MGAIWGDPYAIGGKRGMIPPSEPLESVFSPPKGCHGAYPSVAWVHKPTAHALRDEQGFTDLRCLAPPWGAPMAPPLLGAGGSFYSKFAGKSASFTCKCTCNHLGLFARLIT